MVTSLFFAWGFITANNDPLIVALRSSFRLDYLEAFLVQIVFFLAYGLLSLPSAWMNGRIGPSSTILVALAAMALGCLAVVEAAGGAHFAPILAALFLLAGGFTALQVAANPLAANLGSEKDRHVRLNLAQTFNSLGVVAGVHFGGFVMLSGAPMGVDGPPTSGLALVGVERAFGIMSALLALLFLVFAAVRRRIDRAAGERGREPQAPMFAAFRSGWAVAGAVAIGLYVGAEVSIGSIMINFLNQPNVLGLSFEQGASYLANYYWGGALVGRIIGTLLMTRVSAARLLAFNAASAATLCVVVLFSTGGVSGAAALAIGLFNSIMFPTIFGLTLDRSGVSQSATSGLLCVAICGGAILPLGVGAMADRFGLSMAFAIPLVSYLFIAFFTIAAQSSRTRWESGSKG